MNISIVQSMIDAIDKPATFITTDYTILAVNDAYKRTYNADIAVGLSRCYEVSHGHHEPCDKHGETCPLKECKNMQRTTRVMHIHNTEQGKSFCDILMKPIKDDDGITTGFLEVLDRIEFAAIHSAANKMIGRSALFKKLLTRINRAAKSELAILVHGETGTGKELVAEALHNASMRADKPFIVIECTGLNENLFESELFGHEKGAFTGATHTKKGLIDVANGGTVFFDEIADVPLNMQVKLLRLLETQSYRTLGGLQRRTANFRVICASHKNLLELVSKGEFRKDLYYRIAGFLIELPPLRQRQSDISILSEHFLSQSEFKDKCFSKETLKLLEQYPFPGNIRELKNIVEQAALIANDNDISPDDLPEQITNTNANPLIDNTQKHTLEEVERRYLTMVCKTTSASAEETAQALGVSLRTLYRKLKKHNLRLSE